MRTRPAATQSTVSLSAIDNVGGATVYFVAGEPKAIVYKSRFTVDADGSPHCYHPDSAQGLDALACAGSPGNWWGIYAPPDGEGAPVVQGIKDPAPGYYVSTTALCDPSYPAEYPGHYVDSDGFRMRSCRASTRTVARSATSDSPATRARRTTCSLLRGHRPDARPEAQARRSSFISSFRTPPPGYDSWRVKCPIGVDLFNDWGGMSRFQNVLAQL